MVRLYLLLATMCMILLTAALACGSDDTTSTGDSTGDAGEQFSRLEHVQERGTLVCATGNDTPGFGFVDENGNNVGFDLDLCRAVAAAVLGNPDAVEFRIVDPAERGPILQAGEVDMLSTVTTWTSSRDIQWGNFTQTMFYDGQGFMAPRSLEIDTALELRDASVCVTQGTTTELNLQDFSTEGGAEYYGSHFRGLRGGP